MNDANVAVISGGSRGMGYALVKLFLEQGFVVYTTSRKPVDIDHPDLHWYQADLSKKAEVIAFGSWVAEQVDSVEVLVNNVGIFIPGSIVNEEDGVFEQQLNLNLASGYHLTRTLIHKIEGAAKPAIFNICSTASITPYPNGASYCISKYAQLGMTKVLREELKPKGVRVSAVLPGATLTDSWEGTALPSERFLQAGDIAQMIWAAYQLPAGSVMEEILLRPLEGDID